MPFVSICAASDRQPYLLGNNQSQADRDTPTIRTLMHGREGLCVGAAPRPNPQDVKRVKPCALALTHVPRQKYLNCEQSCTYGWRRIAFNAALRRDAPAVRPGPPAHTAPSPGSPVRDFLSAGHPFFEDRSIASARLCSAVAARSNSGPPWRRDWRTGRTACPDRTKARERYRNVCGETSCPKREGWC
jgi:hypothetical protein